MRGKVAMYLATFSAIRLLGNRVYARDNVFVTFAQQYAGTCCDGEIFD